MIDIFELARKYDVTIYVRYEENNNRFVVMTGKGSCYHEVIIEETDYLSSKVNGDNAMTAVIMDCILQLESEFEQYMEVVKDCKARCEKKKLLKKMKGE